MSLLDKIKNDIVESHVWKSIFRHGYEDTPRNRVMMVTVQRLSPSPSGQGTAPCRAHALYVVHGRTDLSDVFDHRDNRHLS